MISRDHEQRLASVKARAASPSLGWPYIFPALVALLFAAVYSQPFMALGRMWWGSDDYTHGFLVPVIALYMVWRKGAQLMDLPARPAIKSGSIIVAIAASMLLAGRLGSIVVLEELSIPVMVAGLLVLLAGRLFLKALCFPIAYLLFMIKLFGEGSEKFHWPFQLLAADIGVWVIKLLGIPAYKEAQYIQLPNIMLEVASACSGLRFLVSIIAIGVPLAWLTQRTWFRRVALVAFGVFIAILANGARVALIGIWAFYGGKVVHGPMHVFQGMFVAWIGFIALFAGAWFLAKKEEKSLRDEIAPGVLVKGLLRKLATSKAAAQASVTAMIMLACTGGLYFFYKTTPTALAAPLSSLPLRFGQWASTNERTDDFLKANGAVEEFARIYRKDDTAFRVYTGYYDEQAQGHEMVNYRNSWMLHRSERPVVVDAGGSMEKVNAVLLKEGDERRLALFWYQMNDVTIADKFGVKLWTVWEALSERRTNGALVIVSTPLKQDSDTAQLEKDASELAGQVIPAVRNIIKDQVAAGN